MTYIIIESQTTGESTAAITTTFQDYAHAEQQFHTSLAAAAVSSVPVHAVTMLTERGNCVKYECYDHREEVTE